jgi:hypothetical protein
MKHTKRAKRLERYLRRELDWETNAGRYECSTDGCHHTSFEPEKFCRDCGAKMPLQRRGAGIVFDELEQAISYALEEPK